MAEPFVGEIRMFAGSFAPQSWAFCDGQLLSISQNDALFSLLGTIYGGDGRTTFGLPDLRGRIPLHSSNGSAGPGLTPRPLGQKAGAENVTLVASQMPAHTHTMYATSTPADDSNPVANVAASSTGASLYGDTGPVAMNGAAITATGGGGQSHSNLMPTLCVNFIIALFGVYPSRS